MTASLVSSGASERENGPAFFLVSGACEQLLSLLLGSGFVTHISSSVGTSHFSLCIKYLIFLFDMEHLPLDLEFILNPERFHLKIFITSAKILFLNKVTFTSFRSLPLTHLF